MARQEKLKYLYRFLASRQREELPSIWIPAIWNECRYPDILSEKNNEIEVEPIPFFLHHLNYLFQLSQSHAFSEGRDLDRSVIYSSLVRYSAAWDYRHDGSIQSGTFLRFMILLPLLKKMGVNILYLLPVTRYSRMHWKGDVGSPYAVHSLFDLDPELHDPLLDGIGEFSLQDEMGSLVEACHLLGMKVVVDFIPRVTARDSEIIEEHPDWVYWIGKEHLDGFRPPHIPELGFFEECLPDKLETVYRSAETSSFLRKFSLPPNELNPLLWQRLKQRARQSGEPLLSLVEAEMGITTAPAHSDWINDIQPIWTDIAFYRLFKDVSPQVRHLIPPDQPPYVLFDTIKCNMYPGTEPNRELWDMLVEAIEFNLHTYGIDGFRIDIGHVLPVALLEEMFRRIREIRPNAILISEDLFNRNHRKAASTGYNIMLGSGWNIMTDISIETLQAYLKELPELAIHVFACSETADTPRITSRGGIPLARMMSVFNGFLPNAVPFLTTGMEMNEEQPLNCGLGDNTGGADIPRAFFNRLTINWTHPMPMIPLLSRLYSCKNQLDDLIRPQNFFIPDAQGEVLIYAYLSGGELLVGCFNLSPGIPQTVNLDAVCPASHGWTILIDSLADSEPAGLSSADGGQNKWLLQPYQGMVFYHPQIKI
ncbi:alpha-amylase [Paenibacillus sp. DYY-L-2]|uniref:alpha-amylase n=1 Tax=Paenibacillus sp. DYY-L-2 TaxID=3447013 RepID=UPI003F5016CC